MPWNKLNQGGEGPDSEKLEDMKGTEEHTNKRKDLNKNTIKSVSNLKKENTEVEGTHIYSKDIL